MKAKRQTLEKILVKVTYDSAVKNANSTCNVFFGQPTLPEKVKKLRKF